MIRSSSRRDSSAALLLRRLSIGNGHARRRTPWIAVVSLYLRCATLVLPIPTGRSDVAPLIASHTSVQQTSATDRRRRNPHSV
jgi:hypothetical protein